MITETSQLIGSCRDKINLLCVTANDFHCQNGSVASSFPRPGWRGPRQPDLVDGNPADSREIGA